MNLRYSGHARYLGIATQNISYKVDAHSLDFTCDRIRLGRRLSSRPAAVQPVRKPQEAVHTFMKFFAEADNQPDAGKSPGGSAVPCRFPIDMH